MSEENQEVSTRMIGINGLEFEVDEPYKDGHTLTGPEASAFNQLYHENIRNNLRETIKKMVEEGKSQQEMQETVDKYCEEYTIGSRKGGRPRIHDPVIREMRNIAIETIKPILAKQGQAWSPLSTDEKEDLIKRYLAKHGEIAREAALASIAAKKKVTETTLDF